MLLQPMIKTARIAVTGANTLANADLLQLFHIGFNFLGCSAGLVECLAELAKVTAVSANFAGSQRLALP